MELLKKLVLLSLLMINASVAGAEPRVNITEVPVSLTDFSMGYFVDDSQALTYQDISALPFTPTSSKATLGTSARVTWFKVILNNATGEQQQLFVHLPHAYHVRSVEFYQERGGRLVDQQTLDMEEIDDDPLMYRGTAVYPLTIPADQSTTLYLRSHAYSHHQAKHG